MPEKENLDALARHGATMAIHLGVSHIHKIVKELEPHYGADCPVAVCYRVGWPDQDHVVGTLDDIVAKVRAKKITRTALILVGRVLDPASFSDSFLYSEDKAHLYRPKVKPQIPRQVKRS
jgi:precorrin-4/cobalt-precorrin-4 C11-methyltransferase